MKTDSLVYTRAEARRLLGLGENAFDDAVRRGSIPALRFGRRVLIPKAALERLIAEALKPKERAG